MTQASTSSATTWLTQEQFDRLTAELEHLRGPARAEIVKRIEAAREEGDLKENGGYHAAKEEQGKQEARIRQLQQLLENARVGAPQAAAGVVAPGMVITADVAGFEERFLLGSRQGRSGDLDVYSPDSPLGTAINGAKVGSTTSYTAPNGKEITVVIKDAQPYAG
jgi:transcription elongation factor GreA